MMRFLATLFLIIILACIVTAEIFLSRSVLNAVGAEAFGLIAVAAAIFDVAILFLCTGINNGVIFPTPPKPYRFGDPGIGQRDDYDRDIRSPEITAMRDAQQAKDIEKAIRIMER